MASYKVSDNCPDGCLVGNSASSKVGFYGAAPVIQQTTAATATDAATVYALANALKLALTNLGLTN